MQLLVIAIAPAIALLTLFYLKDKYEREPIKQVVKVFFWGWFIVIPAIILESLIPSPSVSTDWVTIFLYYLVVVALVEEGLKFMAVLLLPVQKKPRIASIYNSPDFNESYDGITYTVSASLGFATLENIFYVFEHGTGAGILRAILSVPGHALFGVAMGYFIGKAKFSPNGGGKLLLSGLALATVLHGTYDFLLMTEHIGMILLVLPLMIGMWVLGLKQVKSAQKNSPFINNPPPVSNKITPMNPNKFCTNCGKEIPVHATFCANCGKEVTQSPPLSPNVSLNIERGYCEFCQYCGKSLERLLTKPGQSSYCSHCKRTTKYSNFRGDTLLECPQGSSNSEKIVFEESEKNHARVTFCRYCGLQALVEDLFQPHHTSSCLNCGKPAKYPNPLDTILFLECYHCRKADYIGGSFCPWCGQKVGTEDSRNPKRLCIHCGKEIMLNASFCNFCGNWHRRP